MTTLHVALLLSTLFTSPPVSQQPSPCMAPTLSDQQVKDVIERERKQRPELSAPFPKYRWTVRRQRCHYVYTEIALPEAPDVTNVITLNQYGVIVDASSGAVKCPEKVFTEGELAEIVRAERARRKDVPPPFPKQRTHVVRERCLYMYFEYAVPERRGDFLAFTIDPLGEVMDVYRSKPY